MSKRLRLDLDEGPRERRQRAVQPRRGWPSTRVARAARPRAARGRGRSAAAARGCTPPRRRRRSGSASPRTGRRRGLRSRTRVSSRARPSAAQVVAQHAPAASRSGSRPGSTSRRGRPRACRRRGTARRTRLRAAASVVGAHRGHQRLPRRLEVAAGLRRLGHGDARTARSSSASGGASHSRASRPYNSARASSSLSSAVAKLDGPWRS